jgi:hypothetical protein
MPVRSPEWKLLRLELDVAIAHYRWAKSEAERNGTTPALERFIRKSGEERDVIAEKLRALEAFESGPGRPTTKPSRRLKKVELRCITARGLQSNSG